jgi:hypothetical protein
VTLVAGAGMVLASLATVSAANALPGWTGVAGAMNAGQAPKAGAANQTWVGYFFPLKVGWTCHELLTGSGVSGSETVTVSAVGRTAQGRTVTLDEGSSTTAAGASVPTNAAIHYVLSNSGQLISLPSGVELAGQAFSITGDTRYPGVRSLLSGGSATSRIHISLPLSATTHAELGGVLPANATSLDMTVALTQRGSAVATLQTSMGTFHHVLDVHAVFKSLSFTNVSKSASKELARAITPTIAKTLNVTTWYAPGVGPVKTLTDGRTGSLTSCGQAAG